MPQLAYINTNMSHIFLRCGGRMRRAVGWIDTVLQLCSVHVRSDVRRETAKTHVQESDSVKLMTVM